MVRSAHERCSELVVIVPDQAKSAATIFALGADRILMGTSSDLGPIDPQISVASIGTDREPEFVAARQIIEAVKYGEESIKEQPLAINEGRPWDRSRCGVGFSPSHQP